MTEKKIIAPVWTSEQAASLARWRREREAGDSEIAVESLSPEAEAALREARLPFRTSVFEWDLAETFGKLEETVEGWIDGWFGDIPAPSRDRLDCLLGFDFRRAIHVELRLFLLENLRFFVTLEKLLRDNPPLLLLDDCSARARILSRLAAEKGLSVTGIKAEKARKGGRKLAGELRGKLKLGTRGRAVRAAARNLFASPAKREAGTGNVLLCGAGRFPRLLKELDRFPETSPVIYNLGPASREIARAYSLKLTDEIDSYSLSLMAARKRREANRIVKSFLEETPWRMKWERYDLEGLLSPGIGKRLEELGEATSRYSILFPRLLEDSRVKKLVIWIDQKCREKSLILLAKKRGIDTINIPHGAPVTGIGYLPVDTDYVATWGRGHSGWYRKHGVAEEKLLELGNPEFDKFRTCNKETARTTLFEELRLDPALFLSVMAFSGYAAKNLKISYRDLLALGLKFLNATSSLDEHFTFWKVHRAGYEDPEVYKKLAGTDEKRFIIGRYRDNPGLLSGCDAFFTHDSTIGLEAMLAGTPVFILNFWKRKMALPYAADIPGCEIADPGELPGLIDRLRQDGGFRNEIIEKQNAFLGEYLSGQTSSSSRRIAEWIVSV